MTSGKTHNKVMNLASVSKNLVLLLVLSVASSYVLSVLMEPVDPIDLSLIEHLGYSLLFLVIPCVLGLALSAVVKAIRKSQALNAWQYIWGTCILMYVIPAVGIYAVFW